ncbi:hypothetical protein [Kribbella deserti]|uniref:DUF8175 domain-containing protein n=1 Tax=Kribbella deserti TaxID=1926257 RepID=A0ABV6QUH6_9ACTN
MFSRSQPSRDPARPSFDRGFVAAAILVGAIALCGLALVASAVLDPPTSVSRSAGASDPSGTPESASGGTTSSAGTADPGGSVAPDLSLQPGDSATRAPSVRPDGDANQPGPRDGPAACVVPAGDQRVPLRPPGQISWEVWNRLVVPRSGEFGPARIERDGFRRCFAHSPTGAVFAAYNAIAALADNRQAGAAAAKMLLPGPDTDRLLADLATESAGGHDVPSQLAGFRIIDASPDRVVLVLALRVKDAYASTTFTMVWHRDDWRILAPRPGQQLGAPFSRLPGLGDFVRWSGI